MACGDANQRRRGNDHPNMGKATEGLRPGRHKNPSTAGGAHIRPCGMDEASRIVADYDRPSCTYAAPPGQYHCTGLHYKQITEDFSVIYIPVERSSYAPKSTTVLTDFSIAPNIYKQIGTSDKKSCLMLPVICRSQCMEIKWTSLTGRCACPNCLLKHAQFAATNGLAPMQYLHDVLTTYYSLYPSKLPDYHSWSSQ